ncbi:MAG: hypothetical protein EX272_13375 [Chromatiales bacterium]|nr:MAG: hypothetical protein EX272_13375 [Chromatiales bacterium]
MRPHNDLYEDFDDFEDFAFEKSRAFHKLLDDYRREEHRSHRDHRNSNLKHRWDQVDWDWDDEDDWS